MGVNPTKHALDRYCERILDYGNSTQTEMRCYINQNREKIGEDINKMFEFSRLIYTGQINGDKTTKQYYLNNNIIMVYDEPKNSIVTLYKIDFGFGEIIDKAIVKQLLEQADELDFKINTKQQENEQEILKNTMELENTENEIEVLEEKLEFLKSKKELIKNMINSINTEINTYKKERDSKVIRICNSLDYKINNKGE